MSQWPRKYGPNRMTRCCLQSPKNMGHLIVPAILHLDATVLCHADNPQMCNSSLLPELQTHIQLPTGYISTWM